MPSLNRIIRLLLCAAIMLFSLCGGAAWSQSAPVQSKWNVYLDHAYELTYWEEDELRSWIGEREQEFGQTLLQYAEMWHKKIGSLRTAETEAAVPEERSRYPDSTYKRLAISELLLYIKTGDSSRIAQALQSIEFLRAKMEKPELAYWYYYIHAMNALATHHLDEKKSSDQLSRNIFRIWFDVILPREEANAVLNVPNLALSMKEFSFSLPYLYENLADLIIQRAVIQCEMQNMGSMGVIVQGLAERLTIQNGYSSKVRAIVSRMSGPASDNHNLNFTVVFLEAEESRFVAQNKLNKEGPSDAAEQAFRKAQQFYTTAYQWATTKQGRVAAVTDYLDLVSFAYSRLPEKALLMDNIFFAMLTGHDGLLTIETGIHLYEELSTPEVRMTTWRQNGFSDSRFFSEAMQNLWNSIAEQALWSAYYHEKGITPMDIENYSDKVIVSQTELLLYLKFFERNTGSGYFEIIPDNAYYNAAEAASRYASLYKRLAPYSLGMTNYYRAFARLLQYIELFPYDPEAILELAKELNEIGRPELYVQYVLPLSEKLKNSSIISKSGSSMKNDPLYASIKTLHNALPSLIAKANTLLYLQSKGEDIVHDVLNLRIEALQNNVKRIVPDYKSPGAAAKTKDTKSTLKKLRAALMSSPSGDEEEKKILKESITRLEEEIGELEAGISILSSLPEYIKLSMEVRKNLAQKVDHPAHRMLRQSYHETSQQDKMYRAALRMISGAQEK